MAANETVGFLKLRQFGQDVHAYKVSRNSSYPS
jgi:hypothetical protein